MTINDVLIGLATFAVCVYMLILFLRKLIDIYNSKFGGNRA